MKFPENKDAYVANGTFHERINQIIKLYEHAKSKSYGVSDELRASKKAVNVLLPIAKFKVI